MQQSSADAPGPHHADAAPAISDAGPTTIGLRPKLSSGLDEQPQQSLDDLPAATGAAASEGLDVGDTSAAGEDAEGNKLRSACDNCSLKKIKVCRLVGARTRWRSIAGHSLHKRESCRHTKQDICTTIQHTVQYNTTQVQLWNEYTIIKYRFFFQLFIFPIFVLFRLFVRFWGCFFLEVSVICHVVSY